MSFINNIASWVLKKRLTQIEFFKEYPLEVQKECLFTLLQQAQDTSWGLMYGYGGIKSVREYKERVPIQSYDTLKPFIDKMMQGQQDILWKGEVRWFSKSSGTTADKSKFIPVSAESLSDCHYKAGKDMLAVYCQHNPHTQIFSGKNLVMGGSYKISQLNDNIFCGDVSAILVQNLPLWAEYLRTPDLSIALMDEWEMKIEKMAYAVMQEDVTSITGVPTWTLVLAKRLLEITGKKNLLEIWPNLELYIHGAVSFTPYREQFKQLIPSASMNYLETYNASEGFFAIQEDLSVNDMLLMLDYGIYYEFLPIENVNDPFAKTLELHEVELNKNYALIISTNGGLWRYMIGDTVKFTSLYPFKIQITGRTRHFINAFGEEVIVENAETALRAATEKTKSVIRDYTAGPVYFSDKQSGGHEWIIEFEKAPDNLELFAQTLDSALQQCNSDYEAKRYKDMALRFPVVRIAPDGTFYNWLKAKGKLGGQYKVPRLSNDRIYLDEIKKAMTP